MMEYLFRFDDPYYIDEYSISELRPTSFQIYKETEFGYWIYSAKRSTGGKWVTKGGSKCFARTTIKRALLDYKCRKESQIKIYESRLRTAKLCLSVARGDLNAGKKNMPLLFKTIDGKKNEIL